jgi:hypothetical protein
MVERSELGELFVQDDHWKSAVRYQSRRSHI